MADRGPLQGKCIGASIKGVLLENTVWSDVSRFLSDPKDLIDELLANRLLVQDRRMCAIDLYTRAKLSDIEFDAIAADVERELNALDDRLAHIEPEDHALDDAVSQDVLAQIRQRLKGHLSDAERREIVQLLVRRITVHTTLPDHGPKRVHVVIDYRFPPVVQNRTGTRASQNYTLRRVVTG